MIKEVNSDQQLFRNVYVLLNNRFPHSGEISRSIKLELLSADYENKSAVFEHIARPEEMNFRGTMHGGIVSWLLDTTMGILACGYCTTNNPTLNLNVSFQRAIPAGSKLHIKAILNTVGGHIVSTEGRIYLVGEDGAETLAANGVATFYRFATEHTLDE